MFLTGNYSLELYVSIKGKVPKKQKKAKVYPINRQLTDSSS